MYEISLPKKQIVLTEKRIAILVIYEEILADCGIKVAVDSVSSLPLDAGEERKKGGALLNFLGAPEAMTDLVTTRTRELKLFGAKLDPIAYALYEEYVNYMTAALRKCGVSAANIQKEEIDDSLVLISELFTRFVIQALRSDASIQCKRSVFIVALAKFADRLISEKLLDSDRSEDFRVILIQTHIKWIKSLQNIVSFVEELNKPEDIVTANLNYLKVVEQQLTRHLILELVGQSKADGNWEGKLSFRCLGQTLERVERRVVKQGEKILEKISDDWVVTTSTVDLVQMGIMTDEQNQRQRQVLLIKREQGELSVENFYQLLNRTRLIIRLVERISLLIKTSGWLPMVLNIIDLKAIDEVIQAHKMTCEEIFERGRGNSDAILKTRFGKELGRYNISLAYKHLQKVDRLTELENKALLERIKQFILGDIRELSSLGEALGCYIVTSSPSVLIGDAPQSTHEFPVTPAKLIESKSFVFEQELPDQKKSRDRKKTKSFLHINSKAELPARQLSGVQSLTVQSLPPMDGYESELPHLIRDNDEPFLSTEKIKNKKKYKRKKETPERGKTLADIGRIRSESKLPNLSVFSSKRLGKSYPLQQPSFSENNLSLQLNSETQNEAMTIPIEEKSLLSDQNSTIEIMPKEGKIFSRKLPKKIQLNPNFLPQLDYMAHFLTWVVSNNPTYHAKIESINESRDKPKEPWFFSKFEAIVGILNKNKKAQASFLGIVILVVKEFDKNYMDLNRPWFRDWLWDARMVELYYLKYFCIDAWQKENDIYVIQLVSLLKERPRMAFLSRYNYLYEELVALWDRYIKVDVMANLGSAQDQSQLSYIDQRYQEGKVLRRNDERRALISLDTKPFETERDALIMMPENECVMALTQKLEEFEKRSEKQHIELESRFLLEIDSLKTTNETLKFSLEEKNQAVSQIEQRLSTNAKQITMFQKQLQQLQSENVTLKAELSKLKEKSVIDAEMIQKLEREAKEKEQTIFHLQEKLAQSKGKSVTKITQTTQSESPSPTSSRSFTKKLLKSKKKKHKDKSDDLLTPHSSDESSLMHTDSTELSAYPTSSGSGSIVDRSPSMKQQPPIFDSPLRVSRPDEVKKSLAFVERSPVVQSGDSVDLGNPFN